MWDNGAKAACITAFRMGGINELYSTGEQRVSGITLVVGQKEEEEKKEDKFSNVEEEK